MATIRLLAIDGGGIRGIIPAVILKEIEEKTGQPISKLFHLISGTSTGGIIATGLSAINPLTQNPYKASDILDLYHLRGDVIFNPGSSFRRTVLGLINLFSERYPASAIEGLFEEYFQDQLLSSATRNDLLVTSYDIERRQPRFFKSWRACNKALDISDNKTLNADHENFYLRDIARATSAAPTYFEPAHIQCQGGRSYSLVDGAVFANNPAMCAVSSAIKIYNVRPEEDELSVLSLGTGHSLDPIPHNKAKNWGMIEWAKPILDVLIDGVSTSVDYQLRTVLGSQHQRFDLDLKAYRKKKKSKYPTDELDNAKANNIQALIEAGRYLIADNDEFKRLIDHLMSHPLTPKEDLLARAHDGKPKTESLMS